MSEKIVLFTCIVLVLGTIAASKASADVIIVANQSCRTRMSQADQNISDSSKLVIRTEHGDTTRSYKSWVKFDLGDLAGSSFKTATLTVTLQRERTGSCSFNVSYVNDDCLDNIDWDEESLTWNNAPGNNITNSGALDPDKTTWLTTVDYSEGIPGDSFTFDVLGALESDTDGIVQFVFHNSSAYMILCTHDHAEEAWRPFLTVTTGPKGNAVKPNPSDGKTDVYRKSVLTWTPGIYPGTHNVYFGTDFNDVNDSTTTNPLGDTDVIEGLDVNSYDPGILEFGVTYYWRIDEVNAPPDPTVYKGYIWSFTVEAYSIKIPSANITASASSQESEDFNLNNTIDESGLDLNDDTHSIIPEDMWLTDDANAAEPAWIQYDFDKLYKLHQMLMWNYNGQLALSGYGVKDVNIEYSEDGQTWTQLSSVTQFEKAPGTTGYKYNTTIDFNGLAVKAVRINILNNWGGDVFPQYGLSEVRFMYIPVRAREPYPDIDKEDVPVDVTLSWRAGRGAEQHIVSIGTDQQAVSDGNAVVDTIGEASYGPLSLELGSVYYWRIHEVNNSAIPTTWASDVWSFKTIEYIIVDDFERYTDEEPNRIWDVWSDGWDDNNNGSIMGYPEPDFTAGEHYVETDIIHDSGQSAPIIYNNSSATYSEVSVNVSDLPIGTNWSTGSPETLVLWFYGNSGNTPAQMYVKINNQSPEYYPGDIDAVTQPLWRQWNIDLTGYNLNSITSLAIGFERADTPGGESLVFVDEICLYREAPPVATDEVWIEAESVAINEPLQIYDDTEDDPNASGLQYIGTVEGSGDSSTNPPTTGVATYTFDVDGGVYKVLFRVIIPAGATSDSFWVSFPDATEVTPGIDPDNPGWINFNNIPVGNQWHMAEVTSDDHENQVINVTLPAGTNTMKIAYREDGARLDAILIQKIPE